jgi:hypothetical protein
VALSQEEEAARSLRVGHHLMRWTA